MMIKLIDILNEIKINKPHIKLKAFRNPHGAIYLIFKGKSINSNLKDYVLKTGWLHRERDEKNNSIEFELADHTIKEFKNVLDKLHVPYKIPPNNELLIRINKNNFDIKNINKYTIYDEDIEKENWFNNININ